MYSGASHTTSGTTYRILAPRSLSANKTSTLLPDIAEHSPNFERAWSPSLPRASIRSFSVASFLSDGTVEIEGFGFDTVSGFGDDSVYGGDSLYEGSVYDGEGGESDLSHRAERILANAKRKLDLCGQNISRARSSLILSPSATPTALLDHLDAVGPSLVRRAESAGGSHSQQWKYNNQSDKDDRGMAHLRTASESAVHSVRELGAGRQGNGGMLSNLPEDSREAVKPQVRGGVARSNSTQQMRALRDQMKDLRGKITSLQEQTKTDSLKRRQSISSMRSTPGPYDTATTAPFSPATNLEGIRESRVLSLKGPIEQEWEHVSAHHEKNGDSTSGPDQSGMPAVPRREDVNSPFSERLEYRLDAFSFDSYLFGESFVKTMRPTSMSSDGTTSTATATHTAPRPLDRKGSPASISSYATADEDPNLSTPSNPSVGQPDAGARLQITALRPPRSNRTSPRGSPRIDDGYHSAPHTPRADKELVSPQLSANQPPALSASSWYRDSVDTIQSVSPQLTEVDRSGGVAIASSARDSRTMVVGAMGKEEIELKIGRGDRVLIEDVIEALGKVCVSMETDGEYSRTVLRERLRGAMRVLQGEDPDGEVF